MDLRFQGNVSASQNNQREITLDREAGSVSNRTNAVTEMVNEHQGGPGVVIPPAFRDELHGLGSPGKSRDQLADDYGKLVEKEKALSQARDEINQLEGRLPESRLQDERKKFKKLEGELANQTEDIYEKLLKERLSKGELPAELDRRVKDLAQSDKTIEQLKKQGKLSPEAESEMRKQYHAQMRELVRDMMETRPEPSKLSQLKFEARGSMTMAIAPGEGQLGNNGGAVTAAMGEGQNPNNPAVQPDILLRRIRANDLDNS